MACVKLLMWLINFSEIRSHGVGYYQFSKDQEERKEQMERLQELRQQVHD